VDRVELFLKNFVDAGGEVLDGLSEVVDLFPDGPFAVEASLKRRLARFNLPLSAPEQAKVSITRAKAGVAETGSLVFAYAEEEGFKLITLPEVHVALLSRRRIYDTLDEALSGIKGDYISVVTGPSKTGDIELIHVSGVHGPGRLILVLEGR